MINELKFIHSGPDFYYIHKHTIFRLLNNTENDSEKHQIFLYVGLFPDAHKIHIFNLDDWKKIVI